MKLSLALAALAGSFAPAVNAGCYNLLANSWFEEDPNTQTAWFAGSLPGNSVDATGCAAFNDNDTGSGIPLPVEPTLSRGMVPSEMQLTWTMILLNM